MDDEVPNAHNLESRVNGIKELTVHLYGVGLSIGAIQVGLVENMPVASLFG